MASKPITEAMRQMCSIERRLYVFGRVPSPGLSTDKSNVRADHFVQVFRSETWKGAPDSKRIISAEDLGLTYHEFLEAVRHMPSNKAPGPDGVTAELLKLGIQALMSAMGPLYKAAIAWGLMPSGWSVAVPQLIEGRMSMWRH